MTVVQDFLNRNRELDYFQPLQSHRGTTSEDYYPCQNDELLKTIHMPTKLSQLQTVLPKSKYVDTIESNKFFDR